MQTLDHKVCGKCRLEWPIEMFRLRTDDRWAYRIGTCHDCERKEQLVWQKSNPDKVSLQKKRYRKKHGERIRAHDRKRDRQPARYADILDRAKAFAQTPEGRARTTERIKRWRQENPEKYRAQTAVGNALRDGKLLKGPCASCGTTGCVVGHHHDYSKPLDVTWLCPSCHGAEHRELRWGPEARA